MMDRDTLDKVAQNAHLRLTEDESEEFHEEFTGVLDYFSILDNIPVSEVTQLDPVNTIGTVREDVPVTEIDSEEVLKGIDTYDGYVRGPKL